MDAGDPHDLERVGKARDEVPSAVPTHDRAMREVRAGEKVSHWMWFTYPQLRALGRSATARHFGIADLAEARAYWAHRPETNDAGLAIARPAPDGQGTGGTCYAARAIS